jgi:hypothetical protein
MEEVEITGVIFLKYCSAWYCNFLWRGSKVVSLINLAVIWNSWLSKFVPIHNTYTLETFVVVSSNLVTVQVSKKTYRRKLNIPTFSQLNKRGFLSFSIAQPHKLSIPYALRIFITSHHASIKVSLLSYILSLAHYLHNAAKSSTEGEKKRHYGQYCGVHVIYIKGYN